MRTRARRTLAVAVGLAAVASLAAITTATSAQAAITGLTYEQPVNTNTAFVVAAASSQGHFTATTSMRLVGPGGQTILGTGLTASAGKVTATFNLDPSGVPAAPGWWTALICDGPCNSDLDGSETSAAFTIFGTSPHVGDFTPGARAANSGSVSFTVSGAGFAYGSTVATVPADAAVTLSGVDVVSSSIITGTLNVGAIGGSLPAGFGIKVSNTDASTDTLASALTVNAPPTIDTTDPSPLTVGIGAQAFGPVHFAGAHLPAGGPAVSVSNGASIDPAVSVTVNNPSTTGFDATFTVAGSDTAGARTLAISNGSDGGTTTVPITLTPAPTISGSYIRGQGSSADLVITGTNIDASATATVVGTGISAGASSGTDATHVAITGLSVTGSAVPGAHQLVVVNAVDGGRAACTCFTVTTAPAILSLSPAAVAKVGDTTITVAGQNFHVGALHFAVPNYTVSTPTAVSTTSATITLTPGTGGDAPVEGLTTITATNTNDLGTSSRADLLAVDAFNVSGRTPTGGVNDDAARSVTVTGAGFGADGSALTLELLPPGSAGAEQPIIQGAGTVSGSGTSWTGTVDLRHVAPGVYGIRLVDGAGHSGTCTCTFTIFASGAPTVSAIDPSGVAQGRTLTATITGTGFTPGSVVSFAQPGFTAGTAHYVSSTTITVPVTVGGATTGASAFKVTLPNGGGASGFCSCTVAADANPTVTTVSPGTAGQGATDRQLTVTGTGLPADADGYTFTGGTGSVAVTAVSAADATSVTLQVDVASDATGVRDLVVTNATDGGTVSAAAALTITSAPAPSAITPAYLARGGSGDITIDGAGFGADAAVSIPDVTVTDVVVNAEGTRLTAHAVAAAPDDAARGARAVTVTNGDGGVANCTCQVTLADAPGAPVIGTVDAGNHTLAAHFTPSADSGGAPITGYAAAAIPATGGTLISGTVDGTVASFAGLQNGTLYYLAVTAANAVGTASGLGRGVPRTTPDAPRTLHVRPGNRSVLATWTPPTNDGGAPISGYLVTAQPGSHSVFVAALAYRFGPYTNNKSLVTVTVRAVNAAGQGPAKSAATRPRLPQYDYDGNGTSDIAVFRPSTGKWYVRNAGSFSFGQKGDVPVTGDYDGNSTTEATVYRPSTNTWIARNIGSFKFGQKGDVPVPGDYNGDGRTNVAVFRPSTRSWLIPGLTPTVFGRATDLPAIGDYNGDGKTDIAVFRPSTGEWIVRGHAAVDFGRSGDVPVPGDYNGDGKTDIAVYRPSTGKWFVRGHRGVAVGHEGDRPIPADYNGDGRTDMAIFRPATGTWIIRGQITVTFGHRGDVPV